MNTVQELVEDAVADLLNKHNRPISLKEALEASASDVHDSDLRRKKSPRKSDHASALDYSDLDFHREVVPTVAFLNPLDLLHAVTLSDNGRLRYRLRRLGDVTRKLPVE